jgi:hypothetical protein
MFHAMAGDGSIVDRDATIEVDEIALVLTLRQ